MGTSPSKDSVAGEGLVIEMRKDKSAYGWTGKWTVPDLLAEQVGEAGCHAIAPKLRPGRFRKGQRVFKPGDICELMFVNKGVVSVAEGVLRERVLVQGDYYGSIGVLLAEQRTTEATAEEETEMLFLSGRDIFELVNSGHYELSHSLLFADAGAPKERLHRAHGVAKLLTGGDVHPDAIHDAGKRVPQTQTEEGKKRIEQWKASFKIDEEEDERQRLMKTFPVGSALRGLMKTLKKAEVTVSDPVSVATQYSRIPVKTARALLKVPWLKDSSKYAVAEVLARCKMRSFALGAKVMDPTTEKAHIYLVSRGTFRGVLAHKTHTETRVLKRKEVFGLVGFAPPPSAGVCLLDVEALEDSELLVLAGADLLQVLDLFPDLWDSPDRIRLLFRILPHKGSVLGPERFSSDESFDSSDSEEPIA